MFRDTDLLTFTDELELFNRRSGDGLSNLENKTCVVHSMMEKQVERERAETQAALTEIFARLRAVERQTWWFGGVIAGLLFLGDFLPKLFSALRGIKP